MGTNGRLRGFSLYLVWNNVNDETVFHGGPIGPAPFRTPCRLGSRRYGRFGNLRYARGRWPREGRDAHRHTADFTVCNMGVAWLPAGFQACGLSASGSLFIWTRIFVRLMPPAGQCGEDPAVQRSKTWVNISDHKFDQFNSLGPG